MKTIDEITTEELLESRTIKKDLEKMRKPYLLKEKRKLYKERGYSEEIHRLPWISWCVELGLHLEKAAELYQSIIKNQKVMIPTKQNIAMLAASINKAIDTVADHEEKIISLKKEIDRIQSTLFSHTGYIENNLSGLVHLTEDVEGLTNKLNEIIDES